MGDGERFRVGSMDNVGTAYHGLVAMVWDSRWEMDKEEYLYDEVTNARDLWYDVDILGSTQVFERTGWDILYHHLSRWATTPRDNVWYDIV